MCFGGGNTQRAPNNPAPYAPSEGYKAVDFTATNETTGQVTASKPAQYGTQQTPEQVLARTLTPGLNVKGM